MNINLVKKVSDGGEDKARQDKTRPLYLKKRFPPNRTNEAIQ
jgi:hypothetical protein